MRSPITLIKSEIDALPRAYWLLFTGMLINKIGGFVVPMLAIYLTGERHLSEATAGLVVSSWGLGTFLAGLVGGILADHLGRRITMLFSLCFGAGAMLALGFARELATIVPLAFLLGFTGEMYRPAVSAMVADVVPPPLRQRAYANLYWAVNLGFALAPTLAGLAAHASYTLLFVVDAITSFAYGVLVFFTLPESRPPRTPAAAGNANQITAAAPGIAAVFADRTFMIFAGLTFLFAIVMWQNGVALPLDMTRNGIDAATYGLLISLNGVLIVFLQPPLARAIAGFERTRTLIVASILFGVGFGLNGLVSTPAGYALAVALWTLGEIASIPVSQTVVADLAPPDMRGRYQGINSMAWGLASTLGPTLGGAALGRLGSATLWASCAGVCAVAAFGHALTGPAREREARRRTGVQDSPKPDTIPRLGAVR